MDLEIGYTQQVEEMMKMMIQLIAMTPTPMKSQMT
jgi:hypothetical protein